MLFIFFLKWKHFQEDVYKSVSPPNLWFSLYRTMYVFGILYRPLESFLLKGCIDNKNIIYSLICHCILLYQCVFNNDFRFWYGVGSSKTSVWELTCFMWNLSSLAHDFQGCFHVLHNFFNFSPGKTSSVSTPLYRKDLP